MKGMEMVIKWKEEGEGWADIRLYDIQHYNNDVNGDIIIAYNNNDIAMKEK